MHLKDGKGLLLDKESMSLHVKNELYQYVK